VETINEVGNVVVPLLATRSSNSPEMSPFLG